MIRIPKLFQEILSSNPTLNSAVIKSFEAFEPWIEQSGMPFFPGFTDHSPRHISDVLETAASLLTDETHELLTPEDVAVLCIAILLHDCGMHLTQDGFRALIDNTKEPMIEGFGDRSWSILWQNYLGEAQRFGQDKLIAIFGDSDPVIKERIDLNNLNERDQLLIGEFVRRHHPRLAHEIALAGVPSLSAKKLEIIGLEDDLKDIAGLMARSHGMSIRDTFTYLQNKYSLIPAQRKVKSPFLMAVIRIADYIQVQSERAIASLLSIKELRSPISRQEWKNHFAVKDVSLYHHDPEAFFVNAAPKDVKTYLKLTSLFKDIQKELDESWATIGEVYGRMEGLNKLGLTVRRVRSNLDESDKFAKTVKYIPTKSGFDTSGPDLLKLLVGPLYDYKVEVGIRELIQNAVDACNEMKDLYSGTPNFEQRKVTIEFDENEDGTGWITVKDNGIGMTLETVKNYFLVAGASFRNSDLWKSQHLNELGQSRVMRGGRFGVGALASFLLGEEIEVTTRAHNSQDSEGIEFKARIDDPLIELRRCVTEIGTRIRIWVSNPETINKLRPLAFNAKRSPEITVLDEWDSVNWFTHEDPKVEYYWNGYNADIGYIHRYKISGVFRNINSWKKSEWRALPMPEPYKEVYWRYVPDKGVPQGDSDFYVKATEEVSVNGIYVQDLRWGRLSLSSEEIGHEPRYHISRPSISIEDPSGVCPINLQRSAISFEKMGFDSKFANDIFDYYFHNLLNHRQLVDTLESSYYLAEKAVKSTYITFEGLLSPIGFTTAGATLVSPRSFQALGIDTLYFVKVSDKTKLSKVPLSNILLDNEMIIYRTAQDGVQIDLSWFRGMLSLAAIDNWYVSAAGFPAVEVDACALIMPIKKWAFANEHGRIKRTILRQLKSNHISDKEIIAYNGIERKYIAISKRCIDLHKNYGLDSEIGGWSIIHDHFLKYETSIILERWLNYCQ